MARLEAQFTPTFKRDLKRLDKRHVDDGPLEEVIDLIIENSPESLAELRRRHRMHSLAGGWSGSSECHVCNAGDWLLIWRTFDGIALMQRTGSHDELFR
ncbi:type II toxin-antitoxin system YafQ family toxin [Parafannyhessea umbonata]|jgi:mRNA interferase YafQ|uniref:type II toxin-antitoxin system RelE/ParE family toxin n=1 Tax=Parafannyhessea umbonata TaxID=604330 RepID=UPI0015663644